MPEPYEEVPAHPFPGDAYAGGVIVAVSHLAVVVQRGPWQSMHQRPFIGPWGEHTPILTEMLEAIDGYR